MGIPQQEIPTVLLGLTKGVGEEDLKFKTERPWYSKTFEVRRKTVEKKTNRRIGERNTLILTLSRTPPYSKRKGKSLPNWGVLEPPKPSRDYGIFV